MNAGRMFRRGNIKLYEYLWVIISVVFGAAAFDVSGPKLDLKWFVLFAGTGWASVSFFRIYRELDEKWQTALRVFENALHAYDQDFTKEELVALKYWLAAGLISGLAAFVACLTL